MNARTRLSNTNVNRNRFRSWAVYMVITLENGKMEGPMERVSLPRSWEVSLKAHFALVDGMATVSETFCQSNIHSRCLDG